MNSNKYVVGVMTTLLLTTFSPRISWAGPGGHGGHHESKHEKMAKELNFSAEQRAKMKQIHEQFEKNLPGKKKAMESARADLSTSLQGGASDEDVRKKFQVLQQREAEFSQARFDKVLAIRAILTPEQRQKFKGMDRGWKGKWRHGKDDKDEMGPLDDE